MGEGGSTCSCHPSHGGGESPPAPVTFRMGEEGLHLQLTQIVANWVPIRKEVGGGVLRQPPSRWKKTGPYSNRGGGSVTAAAIPVIEGGTLRYLLYVT